MEPNRQSPSTLASPQPWYAVWAAAVTRPNLPTYEALASQPHGTTARATLWVFLSGTIAALIGITLTLAFPSLNAFPGQVLLQQPRTSAFYPILLCAAPLLGAVAVVGLYASAGISHVIAKALGGLGEFRQLAFVVAAYRSPISMATYLFSAIPVVNCLAPGIGLYSVYLNILAIKAVHRFSWGRAVVSSVLFIAGILFAFSCLLIGILALMGPAIGTVFSNIVTQLGTPMP